MHVKRVLRASQNSVWDVPKPFKIEAWDGPGNPNAAMKLHTAAKRQPRASKKGKRRPRSAQERPGAAQERTKAGQVTPKRAPNPQRFHPKTVF